MGIPGMHRRSAGGALTAVTVAVLIPAGLAAASPASSGPPAPTPAPVSGPVGPPSIEGAAASPVVPRPPTVLMVSPGYDPERTGSSTVGPDGSSGPGTGGLLPVGSGPGPGASSIPAGPHGPIGAVMAGEIEGAAAAPSVRRPPSVVIGLAGYDPAATAAG